MTRYTTLTILMLAVCIPWAGMAAETVYYSYDVFGRLKTVRVSGGPANAVERAYKYDATDNRIAVKVAASWSSDQVGMTAPSSVANATNAGVDLGVNVNGPPFFTGTVTFTENGTFLGSAPVSEGQASIFLQGFSLGTHTITASYSGDGENPPRTFTFTVKVQNLSWLPSVLELILSQ